MHKSKGVVYTHVNVSNKLANSAFNRWCTVRVHECRPTVPTVDMSNLIRRWGSCHKKKVKHSFNRRKLEKFKKQEIYHQRCVLSCTVYKKKERQLYIQKVITWWLLKGNKNLMVDQTKRLWRPQGKSEKEVMKASPTEECWWKKRYLGQGWQSDSKSILH